MEDRIDLSTLDKPNAFRNKSFEMLEKYKELEIASNEVKELTEQSVKVITSKYDSVIEEIESKVKSKITLVKTLFALLGIAVYITLFVISCINFAEVASIYLIGIIAVVSCKARSKSKNQISQISSGLSWIFSVLCALSFIFGPFALEIHTDWISWTPIISAAISLFISIAVPKIILTEKFKNKIFNKIKNKEKYLYRLEDAEEKDKYDTEKAQEQIEVSLKKAQNKLKILEKEFSQYSELYDLWSDQAKFAIHYYELWSDDEIPEIMERLIGQCPFQFSPYSPDIMINEAWEKFKKNQDECNRLVKESQKLIRDIFS